MQKSIDIYCIVLHWKEGIFCTSNQQMVLSVSLTREKHEALKWVNNAEPTLLAQRTLYYEIGGLFRMASEGNGIQLLRMDGLLLNKTVMNRKNDQKFVVTTHIQEPTYYILANAVLFTIILTIQSCRLKICKHFFMTALVLLLSEYFGIEQQKCTS